MPDSISPALSAKSYVAGGRITRITVGAGELPRRLGFFRGSGRPWRGSRRRAPPLCSTFARRESRSRLVAAPCWGRGLGVDAQRLKAATVPRRQLRPVSVGSGVPHMNFGSGLLLVPGTRRPPGAGPAELGPGARNAAAGQLGGRPEPLVGPQLMRRAATRGVVCLPRCAALQFCFSEAQEKKKLNGPGRLSSPSPPGQPPPPQRVVVERPVPRTIEHRRSSSSNLAMALPQPGN